MSTRHRLAAALLRLYPAAWRREYGGELHEILVDRPLTPSVAADVLWSALREHVRAAVPATLLGGLSMLVVLSGFFLPPFSNGWITTTVLSPTFMTFPPFAVTAMSTQAYTVLAIMCGWWTRRRYRSSVKRCGLAAMQMSIIAGFPVVAAGLLLAVGAIHLPGLSIGPSQPAPFAVLVAPIVRLPEYGLLGMVGGWLARRSLHQPVRA